MERPQILDKAKNAAKKYVAPTALVVGSALGVSACQDSSYNVSRDGSNKIQIKGQSGIARGSADGLLMGLYDAAHTCTITGMEVKSRNVITVYTKERNCLPIEQETHNPLKWKAIKSPQFKMFKLGENAYFTIGNEEEAARHISQNGRLEVKSFSTDKTALADGAVLITSRPIEQK